ncbi:MAG: Na(+)/H(+) antiporter subunit F1 [Chloroflexi bacterium]|nr:Na(+)/H(+) antiporter subunit F1 [Chloroflexota bacterium]
MLEIVANLALVVLAVSIALCLYRVIAGPSTPDRIIGVDTIAANAMAAMAIFAIKFGARDYLDAVLVIGLLSFVGTVSLSKYIARGRVIDRDTD